MKFLKITNLMALLILNLPALAAAEQFSELCKLPLATGFPKLTVFAPDLTLLPQAGEKLNYQYVVVVHGPNGNNSSGVITDRTLGLYNKSWTELGGLGKTFQDNGTPTLDVSVTLSGSFDFKGSTQDFNLVKNYQVKTAGLCLDSEPVPLQIISVTVNLPPPNAFKRIYHLKLINPDSKDQEKLVRFEMREITDKPANQLNFKILGPLVPGAQLVFSAITRDGKLGSANVPLEQVTNAAVILDLTADQFGFPEAHR